MNFKRRTERILRECQNNKIAEAINAGRRRNRNIKTLKSAVGTMLQPADFTNFMGTYHDQEQYIIQLVEFSPPANLLEDMRIKIRSSAMGKRDRTEYIMK